MKDITFVDLEVTLNTCRVVDIGAVRSDRTPFHENSFDNLLLFLHQVPYIGGHMPCTKFLYVRSDVCRA